MPAETGRRDRRELWLLVGGLLEVIEHLVDQQAMPDDWWDHDPAVEIARHEMALPEPDEATELTRLRRELASLIRACANGSTACDTEARRIERDVLGHDAWLEPSTTDATLRAAAEIMRVYGQTHIAIALLEAIGHA